MGKIGVFLCVYNRLEFLPETLLQLNQQTFQDFNLHILNNNIKEKVKVEEVVKTHKGELNIQIKHSDFNHGPMIRFYEAKISEYDYVVFLDDDEAFSKNMMEVFNSEKSPCSMSSRVTSNFTDSFISRTRVVKGEAKYVGPGGLITDASIFRKPEFWDEWKPEYYVIDDMWLSYFASKLGWKKTASKVAIVLKSSTNTSMLRNINIQNLKQAFIEQYNWKGDK